MSRTEAMGMIQSAGLTTGEAIDAARNPNIEQWSPSVSAEAGKMADKWYPSPEFGFLFGRRATMGRARATA